MSKRRRTNGPRLSAQAYTTIRALVAAGWSQVRVGKATGVTGATISRTLSRKSKGIGRRDIEVDWAILTGSDDPVEHAKAQIAMAVAQLTIS